jgi:putative flippase GtrA|tara:strand:+ start:1715 stop:2086 length:372 start_codon:yes stop_codon:yes gene_type:complete
MPKKFFVVGVINAIFGYSVGILNYFLFFELIGIIGVGIINNILAITLAFILFKKFVFKTINTNWILEYIRSYLVYGIQAIMGIFILWLCITVLKLNIYFSQALSMITAVFISYTGHKKFTFKI